MEIFREIIMIGVNGACQGFPLRWIGCFDYRLDSVDQLVHVSKGFFAHFDFSLFGFPGYDLIRPQDAMLGRCFYQRRGARREASENNLAIVSQNPTAAASGSAMLAKAQAKAHQ
jgi:hypothetical protein